MRKKKWIEKYGDSNLFAPFSSGLQSFRDGLAIEQAKIELLNFNNLQAIKILLLRCRGTRQLLFWLFIGLVPMLGKLLLEYRDNAFHKKWFD